MVSHREDQILRVPLRIHKFDAPQAEDLQAPCQHHHCIGLVGTTGWRSNPAGSIRTTSKRRLHVVVHAQTIQALVGCSMLDIINPVLDS